MKIPKIQRRYCPSCDKHTEHVVSQAKTGKSRKLSKGSRRKLGALKGHGSSGRYSRPPGGRKSTKKIDLRFKCKVCGKSHLIGKGFRAKKIEIE